MLREEGEESQQPEETKPADSTTVTLSKGKKQTKKLPPIKEVKYDYYTRPLLHHSGQDSDGTYQVANPVDPTTGLWYQDDWAEMVSTYIRHGYDTALLSSPEQHPLLLVERSYNPPPIRQQVLEILMEDIGVPAAFLARDATMACYACGRTTGTVVDMGYNGTVVSPVYDGYVEQKGIRRSPMGTMAMDEAIASVLDTLHRGGSGNSKWKSTGDDNDVEMKTDNGFLPIYRVRGFAQRHETIHRLSRLEIARQCREMGPGAAVAAASLESTFQAPHMSFELPDGQSVDIPAKDRFAVSDQLLGNESEESVEARETRLSKLQEAFQKVLVAAAEGDDDDENNEDDDDDDAAAEKERYKNKYSEAAAVGLLKRRDESGGGASGGKKRKRRSTTKDTQSQQHDKDEKNDNNNNSNTAGTTTGISFSNRQMQKACAAYLTAHQDYLTSASIPNMVSDAAFRCDRDQQASLLGNVVLVGGGACLGPTDQAMPEGLKERVEAIIHQHTPGWRVKVLSPNVPERAVASWLGGSILGSLGTFHDMWVSRKEYEEWGTAIVNRKCP